MLHRRRGTTSSIDAGVHYYDLIPFQVDRTDYYTILVSDDFGSTVDESAIALFARGLQPVEPCENIIAFQDRPIDDNPAAGNDEPYIRISLPLIAGDALPVGNVGRRHHRYTVSGDYGRHLPGREHTGGLVLFEHGAEPADVGADDHQHHGVVEIARQ